MPVRRRSDGGSADHGFRAHRRDCARLSTRQGVGSVVLARSARARRRAARLYDSACRTKPWGRRLGILEMQMGGV
jgi:hypothetical protein